MTEHGTHDEHPDLTGLQVAAMAIRNDDDSGMKEALDTIAVAYDPSDTTLPAELHEAAQHAIAMGISPESIRVIPTQLDMNDAEDPIANGFAAAILGHQPDIECLWGHEEGVRHDIAKWEPGEQEAFLETMGLHGARFKDGINSEMDSMLRFFTGEDGPDQALGALAGISWFADRLLRLVMEGSSADVRHEQLVAILAGYSGIAITRSAQEIIRRFYTPLGDLDGQLEQLLAEPFAEIDLRDLLDDQSPADGNGNGS